MDDGGETRSSGLQLYVQPVDMPTLHALAMKLVSNVPVASEALHVLPNRVTGSDPRQRTLVPGGAPRSAALNAARRTTQAQSQSLSSVTEAMSPPAFRFEQ